MFFVLNHNCYSTVEISLGLTSLLNALRNMTRFVERRPCWIGGPRELVRLGRFATVGCSGEEQVLPLPPVVAPPSPPPTARRLSSLVAAETASKKVDLPATASSLSETDDFGVFLRRLSFPSRPP